MREISAAQNLCGLGEELVTEVYKCITEHEGACLKRKLLYI